jgi:hypothetical protein
MDLVAYLELETSQSQKVDWFIINVCTYVNPP